MLLREVRVRAGLSQRALADRASTTQSVIARIEGGKVSPTWGTLVRLATAAGLDLHVTFGVRGANNSHMLDDVSRILALSPEERLHELGNVSRFLAHARRV